VGHKVKLALGSRINYVDLVHEMAEDLARGSHFPKAAALDIALAVREAFINAVKHGNDSDAAKKIEVEFESNASRFMVRVRDEGEGFDWDRPADPLAEENISRASGRGIFFMKHFVDRVAYQKLPGRGTEVLLEKHLQPADDDGEAMKRRKE
jgi:serine/threonine-protein kinase RsbW